MSYIEALKADIQAKEKELADVLALIEKSKGLMADVEHMKSVLFIAENPGKKLGVKAVGKKGGRKPFTEEQKAAASLRQKAAWAARKASPKGSAAPSRAKSS